MSTIRYLLDENVDPLFRNELPYDETVRLKVVLNSTLFPMEKKQWISNVPT